MNVADGVEMLEIPADFMGRRSLIHPVIISDKDDVVLIDTGFPGPDGGAAQIREQALAAGIPFGRLSRVILTHQDKDHIGGLTELIGQAAQEVETLAHVDEKPYIEGTKRLVRFTPEHMAAIDALPEDQSRQIKSMFENPPTAPIDRAVRDGEELPWGGGIVVVHTPGHTPGHICLYLKQSKILVAGDALNVVEGSLAEPNPQLSADMNCARESLKRLSRYDIRTVICYHGGAYSENVNERIAELAGA
jgi:glyoxylase-like metal-dependent hydrolase (beta-lactamase superfamily II)